MARAVSCVGLKFWRCQNVDWNPGLAARRACILEQDTCPVCCVMHVKEPRKLIVREGACPGVSGMTAKCAEIICASE